MMHGGKLHLKRTPAEQEAHDVRKARKAARKSARKSSKHERDEIDSEPSSSSNPKRRRRRSRPKSDDDVEQKARAHSSHRSHKPDYDYIFAQKEEDRFREKMWSAFEDDERLDATEARFNDYAHIPRRWRSGGMDRMDDDLATDPSMMEDEDYAEWVRAGMYRRKHAAEFEEQARQEAERKARHEREKAIRAETKRLEKEAEQERRRKRIERQQRKWSSARENYETTWSKLLSVSPHAQVANSKLLFCDIPWPIFVTDIGPLPDVKGKKVHSESVVELEDFTAEAISIFLFPQDDCYPPANSEDSRKERKEKLRETMLRFHPDKFEGRIMKKVVQADQEKVREAVGLVARALNTLMAEKTS